MLVLSLDQLVVVNHFYFFIYMLEWFEKGYFFISCLFAGLEEILELGTYRLGLSSDTTRG